MPAPSFTPITPTIQSSLTQVNCIYQHPLHYTYILHKVDGFLYLYDNGTMDSVGKTKVFVLDQMKLFAFTNDFNLFYGLRQNRFLSFELMANGALQYSPVDSSQQIKPYFQSYYISFYSKRQCLLCVTKSSIYFVSVKDGTFITSNLFKPHANNPNHPTHQHPHSQQIYPQKITQVLVDMWLIFYQKNLYLITFNQNFQYEIKDKLYIGYQIVKLATENNPKKEFAYLINQFNQLLLIKVYEKYKKIQVCYKFFNQKYIPYSLTLLRLGINSSTSDKERNRIYIIVYAEEKCGDGGVGVGGNGGNATNVNNQTLNSNNIFISNKSNQQHQILMIDQNNQSHQPSRHHQSSNKNPNVNNAPSSTIPPPFPSQSPHLSQSPLISPPLNHSLFIIPTETQYLSYQNGQQFQLKLKQQSFIVTKFPQLKSPFIWINVLFDNCLFFLTKSTNQVNFINFANVKELKICAEQWVCMGYRFEILQKNQVYEEKQQEFEDDDDDFEGDNWQTQRQIQRIQRQNDHESSLSMRRIQNLNDSKNNGLTKEFLNDWSQSLLPRQCVLKRTQNLCRIRAFDIL